MKKISEIISMEKKERVHKITGIPLILILFAIFFLVLQVFFNVFLLLQWKDMRDQMKLVIQTSGIQKEKTYTIEDEAPLYGAENEEKVLDIERKPQDNTLSNEHAHSKDTLLREKKKTKVDNKKIYLTFDDGPSVYTDDILDILKRYQVKATFFVIGKTDPNSIRMYQRMVQEGHTLGLHSYSHRYDEIYGSVKNFDKDFKKLNNLLMESTGVEPKYYRFPGGSSNGVSKVSMNKFIAYLSKKNMVYFDWNVVNGDAEKKALSVKEMRRIVLKDVKKFNTSIVLMHDTDQKETTVKFLPGLIERLLKEEYEILPIDENTTVVHHKIKP